MSIWGYLGSTGKWKWGSSVDRHEEGARKIFLNPSQEFQDAPQPDGSFWATTDELAPPSSFLELLCNR